jgi:hypothetical protein
MFFAFAAHIAAHIDAKLDAHLTASIDIDFATEKFKQFDRKFYTSV